METDTLYQKKLIEDVPFVPEEELHSALIAILTRIFPLIRSLPRAALAARTTARLPVIFGVSWASAGLRTNAPRRGSCRHARLHRGLSAQRSTASCQPTVRAGSPRRCGPEEGAGAGWRA